MSEKKSKQPCWEQKAAVPRHWAKKAGSQVAFGWVLSHLLGTPCLVGRVSRRALAAAGGRTGL